MATDTINPFAFTPACPEDLKVLLRAAHAAYAAKYPFSRTGSAGVRAEWILNRAEIRAWRSANGPIQYRWL